MTNAIIAVTRRNPKMIKVSSMRVSGSSRVNEGPSFSTMLLAENRQVPEDATTVWRANSDDSLLRHNEVADSNLFPVMRKTWI